MKKNEIMIVAGDEANLTLEELSQIYDTDFILALIDYAIIEPKGKTQQEWIFDLDHIRRIKTAHRLTHDLEINLAGVALALDLLDQIEELRTQLVLLEIYK